MLNIELCEEAIEGEPGPNFYWKGSQSDFLKLTFDLHKLGTKNGEEIDLSTFDYVYSRSGEKTVLRSIDSAKILYKNINGQHLVELDMNLWREVLYKLFSITFCESHNYIEFDNLSLEENANFIISSEH